MAAKYDAIIIGGGHNGLVAAAYLARAGRRVLVLERREMVGGCAVTEEIWPGYRVSTAAYLASLLQERLVRELELERFGYHVDAKDPAFFSAFPDGRHFFMWQDRAKTVAEIARFSRHDAGMYPAYEDQIERIAGVIEGLLLVTPPEFPPRSAFDFLHYLKLAGRLRGLGRRDLVALVPSMRKCRMAETKSGSSSRGSRSRRKVSLGSRLEAMAAASIWSPLASTTAYARPLRTRTCSTAA